MAGTTSSTPGLRSGSGLPSEAAAPLRLTAYRIMTRLASPAAGLILGMREKKGKEDPARRNERLGIASCQRPQGVVVWVHAASVGESAAVLPVIRRLAERRPDISVLLTTGTVTSARFVSTRLPPGTIHQYVPLDGPTLVSRFLDQWKPAAAVLTEQEVWPNLVIETGARGIPLALVNARMSDRSFARWQRRMPVARALYSRFSVVLAQNDSLAKRFADLGAQRAVAVGNLKIDAPPPLVDAEASAALRAALGRRPCFVAASTHDGEEGIIADAHRMLAERIPGFCTIIAPRHPERGEALAQSLTAVGFRVARRSMGELPSAGTDIYVADTIGELGTLYSLAPIAFVGGSLVAHGGQNPIEAVRCGAAVLTGPSRQNFADVYETLLAADGAIEVTGAAVLAETVIRLLGDAVMLYHHRERARRALDALSGALDRTVVAILPFIPEAAATEGVPRAL